MEGLGTGLLFVSVVWVIPAFYRRQLSIQSERALDSQMSEY
jgi:hypothetical protein